MTTEEAIVALQLREIEFRGKVLRVCEFLEALDMAISALRAQQEKNICGCTNLECSGCVPGPCEHRKHPNAALTLDELRQMDGEPVWIVWPDGRIKSKWWIVGNYDWRMMEFDEKRDYGKNWLAYRYNPEEGAT